MNIIPLFSRERKGIFRIFWLYGLLAVVAMGCGDDGQPDQSSQNVADETASVLFSVRWITPAEVQDSDSGAVTKSTIAEKCTALGVKRVKCNVYDDKNVLLTFNEWECADGGGEIKDIVPGPGRQFVILGLDNSNEVVYQGETPEGVTIEPGVKTTVAPIDAYPFVPSGLKTEAVSETQINISWTTSEENTGIIGYRLYDADGALIGDTPSTTFHLLDVIVSLTSCYTVSAYDKFENASKPSDRICLETTNRITDTGQSTSYTDTHGEDADYDIITPSYTKLDADGNPLDITATDWAMVKDDVTGLVWEVKKKGAGNIHQNDKTYTWGAAKDTFIAQLNTDQFGGHEDWRLPSRTELYSLIYANASGPSVPLIDTTYFPNGDTQIVYWTSSPVALKADEVWWVALFSGRTGSVRVGHIDEEVFLARAVRGKQIIIDLEDNGNGTVTDRTTGLMWQQSPPIPSEDSARWTWEEALTYCENLTLAGYDDWRLPNIKELSSIVEENNANPAIDAIMFPNTQTGPHHYWTSTTDPRSSGELAYGVEFFDGFAISGRPKTAKHNLRAVRGGR